MFRRIYVLIGMQLILNAVSILFCCFISESWDRDSLSLEEAIRMDGYRVIKNVLQRGRKGGKPALMISEKDYLIKELCPDVITVPPNIEAVWALLTFFFELLLVLTIRYY